MKSKSKYLIAIILCIFIGGGVFVNNNTVLLNLNNQAFDHQAYSFVPIKCFYQQVAPSSKYSKLDIFIIYEKGSEYNIDSEIEAIYKKFNLSITSKNLIPVSQDFKIKYIAQSQAKKVEKIKDVNLTYDRKIILYDYNGEKVLDGQNYLVKDKKDLEQLLSFRAYLQKFDQDYEEISLNYNSSINIEKDGSYPLSIFNKENSFNQDLVVTVKKPEIEIKPPQIDKPTPPPSPEKPMIITGNLSNINVLVNKEYHLGSGDVPKLANVPANYALNSTYQAHPEAIASFIEMVDAMEKEINMRIIITSAYRSYQYQKDLFERYVARDGLAAAERYSARPGQSEHQTGLAIDVSVPNGSFLNFGGSPQSQWINNNAHRFGYIVRYKEGMESITGYMAEPWHLRYLAPDLATKVFFSNLTYDEYYLSYLQ